jgi:hypothetical protein
MHRDIFQPQIHGARRDSSESPPGHAVVAIGMLCVPLICFGCVLAVYLILTI